MTTQTDSEQPQITLTPEETTETVKKRGRPKKTNVVAKKAGNRGVRGRPKGDAAIINEYKARMLASPKSRKVLEKIFEVALDDEHKNQAACMKMLADRIIPVAAFEQEITKGNGKSSIQINISGIGSGGVNIGSTESSEVSEEDYIEGEIVKDD